MQYPNPHFVCKRRIRHTPMDGRAAAFPGETRPAFIIPAMRVAVTLAVPVIGSLALACRLSEPAVPPATDRAGTGSMLTC